MSTSTEVKDHQTTHGVYALAGLAEVRGPDTKKSPGVRLLTSCQESANEFDAEALLQAARDYVAKGNDIDNLDAWDLGNDIDEQIHQEADSSVQIYTSEVWKEFADLCLWEEDLSDLGEVSGEHLTRDVAMRAEYMVAKRLIAVLVTERAQEIYALNTDDLDDEGE
jgi:hypothetical protein